MTSHQLDPDSLRRHRRSNFLQATALLLALGGVLALAGWIVAGGSGVIGMLIGGAIVVSMTPKIGPLVLLRLYGARALQPSEAPPSFTTSSMNSPAGRDCHDPRDSTTCRAGC